MAGHAGRSSKACIFYLLLTYLARDVCLNIKESFLLEVIQNSMAQRGSLTCFQNLELFLRFELREILVCGGRLFEPGFYFLSLFQSLCIVQNMLYKIIYMLITTTQKAKIDIQIIKSVCLHILFF